MNPLRSFLHSVTRRKSDARKQSEIPYGMLTLQATYNYGVSLFHLGQDWAYEHAVETFLRIIDVIPPTDERIERELRQLAQGSLACTYARLATRKPQQKKQYCDLTFAQTQSLLANPSISREARVLALTANGLAYLALNEYDRAINSFQSATELEANIIALLGLGEAYMKEKKREEALEAYQKANQMTSAGGYAAYKLGNLFREINNKDLAKEAYKRASALSVARLALGKLYLEDGDLEAALEEFRRAVEFNRKSAEAWANIAWTILEMPNADDKLIDECVDAAQRSLQMDVGGANEWHRRTILALSLVAAQKPEQALKEAKLGLGLAVDNAQAQYCVALCEFHLNRPENARKILLDILRSQVRGLWRTKAESLMKEINKGTTS